MPSANLQTVIVSKGVAKTRMRAERLADPHANRIYTSRETKSSFRFRQRPPSDFKKNSFRTFPVPGHSGIALVYGELKSSKQKNPGRKKSGKVGRQRYLQWKGAEHSDALMEWDFWLVMSPQIRRAKTDRDLAKYAKKVVAKDIQSETIRGVVYGALADRARELRKLHTEPTAKADEKYVRSITGPAKKNPSPKRAKKKAPKATDKKKVSKKAPKAIKLSRPKVMPHPGSCAWLGNTLEISFDPRQHNPSWTKDGEKGRTIWDSGRRNWMCLWSPKYKAVVVIPKPRGLKGGPGCKPRKGKVVRDGGGASLFERFAARAAEGTQEIEVDACPIKKLGNGVHVVYRSDKWSESRTTTDYIHDFKKGVQIYCGPTIEKPELFIIFGGKLTLTERGLVF